MGCIGSQAVQSDAKLSPKSAVKDALASPLNSASDKSPYRLTTKQMTFASKHPYKVFAMLPGNRQNVTCNAPIMALGPSKDLLL